MPVYRFRIAFWFGLVWAIAPLLRATAQQLKDEQPRLASSQADVVFMAWQGNAEVKRCGVCHFSPGNSFAKRETDFCCLDELQKWLELDKHAMARQRIEPIAPSEKAKALEGVRTALKSRVKADMEIPSGWFGDSNFLSLTICQKLGYDIQSEEGYARFRDDCLTCHGGYRAPTRAEDLKESARPASEAVGFARHDVQHPGISCNYCHQITRSNDQWIDDHSSFEAKSKWRTLSPAVKAEKGMRDLVSAEAQSKLCFQCHVGDIEQKMFVTHQMYAAGHPPLPSVELNTFINAMPRHWRTPDELYAELADYPQRSEYFATSIPALTEVQSESVETLPWSTYTMVFGALGSQQQSLRLIAQAAQPSSEHWGDYALYDCAACHHELRDRSVRQKAREGGIPGRPRLLEWPKALSLATADAIGEHESFSQWNSILTKAVTRRPFGERETVGRSASEFADAIEQMKRPLTTKCLTQEFLNGLLTALTDTPDELLVDYHSARQINWAVRCIDADMAKLGHPLRPEVRAAIEQLGVGSEPFPMQVTSAIPVGLNNSIYPDFVKTELERQASYNSEEFRRQLKTIGSSSR